MTFKSQGTWPKSSLNHEWDKSCIWYFKTYYRPSHLCSEYYVPLKGVQGLGLNQHVKEGTTVHTITRTHWLRFSSSHTKKICFYKGGNLAMGDMYAHQHTIE
jgi:hypothetical protein